MPGFLRGRRYVAQPHNAGTPKFLTYYDLHSAAVMLSEAHTALRCQRTERDRYFVLQFRNTIKGICDVASYAENDGGGDGENLVLLPVVPHVAGSPGARDELVQALAALPRVVRAVLGMRNAEVTQASSAKDDRAGDRYLQGLIAVEAATEDVATAVSRTLHSSRLEQAGVKADLLAAPAVLRLSFALGLAAHERCSGQN